MKLIEVLNKANKGRKIPMYVWDVYIGSKYETYAKMAKFFKESFDYASCRSIKLYEERNNKLEKKLVEIDHLEEDDMGREVILFLKLDDKIVRHYEPANASFYYNSMLLNEKMEIIGGTKSTFITMTSSPFYI